MATYNIAPATTGSEIGLAQMRYSLANSANYNNANLYTVSATNMQTLVTSPTTYQASLDSKTWNTSQPYGFAEMAGQTWSTAVAATISYNFSTLGDSLLVTVKQGGSGGTTIYSGGAGTGTLNVNVGDSIYVQATATFTVAGAIQCQYRQPAGTGGYTTLFSDSVGSGGGAASGNGTFSLTQTTSNLVIS